MSETSEWVQIIHPETGGISEVPRSSLYQWYQGGWRLLADDEAQALEPEPQPEPAPVSKAQAAKAAKNTAESEG